MINQPLFIKTRAGIISRDAARFVEMLEPMVDVGANQEEIA